MRERIRRDLAELPILYERCEPVSTRMGGPVAERVTGSRPMDLRVDPVALNARSDALHVLAAWTDLVVQERGLDAVPRRTVASLAAFLATHLDWLLNHPAAADFALEVRRVTEAVAGSAHPSELNKPIGPCVHDDCAGTLHAVPGTDGGAPLLVRCDAMGHAWSPDQWLILARRLRTKGVALETLLRAHSSTAGSRA